MRPLIYDCFLFWREFDLLELRLRELAGVVDYFVLVEATHAFSDAPKPLHFREQRARYATFADRIIHVIVDDLFSQPGPWEREYHQRNALVRGLRACRAQDAVLLSDVDEIPRPQLVGRHLSYPGVTVFFPQLSYYFLNCQASRTYPGPCMLPCGLLAEHQLTVQRIRTGDIGPVPYQVEHDGGWHFSFCSEAEEMRDKIAAYAHQEYNLPAYTDLAHLEAARAQGTDLSGRQEMTFQVVPVDESFPRVVREQPARYSHLVRQ